MMPGLTDEQLCELYRKYAPVVYRRAYALLGRDADAWDVVQETFKRLLDVGNGLDLGDRPVAYLFQIATNHCLDRLRSQSAREPAEEDLRALQSEFYEACDLEARELIRVLTAQLPERELRVASLHFVDGLTQEEIGATEGYSRKTIGKLLKAVREYAGRLAGGGNIA